MANGVRECKASWNVGGSKRHERTVVVKDANFLAVLRMLQERPGMDRLEIK